MQFYVPTNIYSVQSLSAFFKNSPNHTAATSQMLLHSTSGELPILKAGYILY